MPVHDWSLALPSDFQEFHSLWIGEVKHALNKGLLPADYYAVSEARIMGYIPDVLTYEKAEARRNPSPGHGGSQTHGGTALLTDEVAPRVRYLDLPDHWNTVREYRVSIRNQHSERLVAFIELVSNGNKDRVDAVNQFNDKLEAAIRNGCNVMVVDVHQPGTFDPLGMHKAFWSRFAEAPHGVTDEEPLGVASYHAPLQNGTLEPMAYFETVAIGKNLPDMPLFLEGRRYINVPLQSLYDNAWDDFPAHWKTVLEAPKTP